MMMLVFRLQLSVLPTIFCPRFNIRPIRTHTQSRASKKMENWPGSVHFIIRTWFWHDLCCVITATDNTIRWLIRRWHINVIDWQLKGSSPSGKRCGTYWSIVIIKQGIRKEEDYPIDRDRDCDSWIISFIVLQRTRRWLQCQRREWYDEDNNQ